MENSIQYVGLDVHKNIIAAAVCEQDGSLRSLGNLPNEPEAIARLMRKLGPAQNLRVCYEAGPCGYVLYWQLCKLGIDCQVIAPSLIPDKPGDRVKTNRRDAIKLARCHRNGDLTAVFVPDDEHLALRELVRAREDALQDRGRARLRLKSLLLRYGIKPQGKLSHWSARYLDWLNTVKLAQAATQDSYDDALAQVIHQSERLKELERKLQQRVEQAPEPLRAVVQGLQCLVGVKVLTATTVAVETVQLSRFDKAPQLFSYAGLVPSERSSGDPGKRRQGAITKTGNAHIRRVIVEAAWSYSRPCSSQGPVAKRRQGQDPVVVQIANKGQKRLRQRYLRLVGRGMAPSKAATAVARELLGFMWAIAKRVQAKGETAAAAN